MLTIAVIFLAISLFCDDYKGAALWAFCGGVIAVLAN
jgi:hypothetical protein